MSNILDKFGIYDLVAVLLSGMSIVTVSWLLLEHVYHIDIGAYIQLTETMPFLVISYFVGLIFQELGSILEKAILHKKNRLLKAALKEEDDSSIFLTREERDGALSYAKKKCGTDNANVIYNYCKFYVLREFNTGRIDKDQSISAMSRSLAVYFLALTVISFLTFISNPMVLSLILTIVFLLFSVILGYRAFRFARLRHINIYRTFYYNVVVKENNKK